MSHYAMVAGRNAAKWSESSDCKFGRRLKDYHADSEKISVVALGPDNYFAVVTASGGSWCLGPDGFMEKMQEIEVHKIKHISFGESDQWVITMKSGVAYCELRANGGVSIVNTTNSMYCALNRSLIHAGCLQTLNEYNGKITYVSLCDNRYQWVVGWGSNGHHCGSGVDKELQGYLQGLHDAEADIKLVELGNDQWFVHHSKGLHYSVRSNLSNWYNEQEDFYSTISLW